MESHAFWCEFSKELDWQKNWLNNSTWRDSISNLSKILFFQTLTDIDGRSSPTDFMNPFCNCFEIKLKIFAAENLRKLLFADSDEHSPQSEQNIFRAALRRV